MSTNLDLWNKVRTPDPEHTSKFQVAGGFKGTSTDAMYLVRRATEIWGQIGKGWGYGELERVITHDTWFSYVELWYKEGVERHPVYHWGGAPIRIETKDGRVRIDDEAAKKALTNGLSKCLSQLGFAADIYMGLFDDDKYVQEAKKQFEAKNKPKPETATSRNARFKKLLSEIQACEDTTSLQYVWQSEQPAIVAFKAEDETFYDELIKAKDLRKKAIADKELEGAGYPPEFLTTPTGGLND
jgi:hypothetical protein